MDQIKMRRSIGNEYQVYDDYIEHQKKKTTDPIKRKKWLGKEWQMKIDVFS